MDRLIACIPNVSEGRNPATIEAIRSAITSVDGVRLLDVDPGIATNRTVFTFVGAPDAVVEAAVRTGAAASESIDMRTHTGEHPRFGGLDVCPLVPVSGVSMEEAARYARTLAQRLGDEVGLTVYCYEAAATVPERRNLADVRMGEYEGLAARLADPAWAPDFGPGTFNARSGATAVGARGFLVAYNINLNTTSTRIANAIAFDVREKGRPKRIGDPLTGEIELDENGDQVWIPGTLKGVKAIGWFIDEYGIAQISMNITDIDATPVHAAFDEVCRRADARGVRVTGSELVGVIPLRAMLDAGRYFLHKQHRSTGVSDAELVRIAVRSLGLDDLAPFDPHRKIIEYAIGDRTDRLADLPVRRFIEDTASESPAPGGGSVAAAVGALGAALGTMVANLSSHKRGWDDRWEEFSNWADEGKRCQDELVALVDADTDAFNGIMAAIGMPKSTDEERRARDAAIQAATHRAIEVPLHVMEVALGSMGVIGEMARIGNPASASDAGVGALCARTAVLGAGLNVRINAKDLDDRDAAANYVARAAGFEEAATSREAEILGVVDARR
jgi:glutamate formiminotransferase/formiminotetrahydrofolate cyclodeaminase